MRLTLKGDKAYLSCFDTPGAQVTVTGVIAQPDAKIKMLGSEEEEVIFLGGFLEFRVFMNVL
ncbi:hypothetical protein AKJ65_05110 [candidate division MSBL1 archaeon SCGC-AAA259E19]|uniref:Uncharacterized protein n=1 Tax=candidate division MSBL1 archaeon SCGC-AAA259E19 TaxID=1698264 RepID=A0A133UJH2_9EURY|nr:hypothetical protein AKJ65_05110 [candidate division MSBL1 archaeon SCGC-AAA259E19]